MKTLNTQVRFLKFLKLIHFVLGTAILIKRQGYNGGFLLEPKIGYYSFFFALFSLQSSLGYLCRFFFDRFVMGRKKSQTTTTRKRKSTSAESSTGSSNKEARKSKRQEHSTNTVMETDGESLLDDTITPIVTDLPIGESRPVTLEAPSVSASTDDEVSSAVLSPSTSAEVATETNPSLVSSSFATITTFEDLKGKFHH